MCHVCKCIFMSVCLVIKMHEMPVIIDDLATQRGVFMLLCLSNKQAALCTGNTLRGSNHKRG